jgi:hypothetical protein
MSSNRFQLPISAPTRAEAEALARAADYLHRAATELQSRNLGLWMMGDMTASADLPAALTSAGNLCAAILETASRR